MLARRALSLETIRAFIAAEMRDVDLLIHQRLYSDVALIRRVAEYITGSGGKRLRPVLVLLASGALGCRTAVRFDLAAVIEFIHTATLLHDDVVDESDLRRGRQTANAMFGNAASVLVGDFLYSRAFQMMVDIGHLRVMRVLADATNTIAEGEVLQLLNCNNADIDEEAYLRVIRYKTAKLFEAATRCGAIVGGGDETTEEALARYGMHLGTAFQLIDDVLDYSGDYHETGKNIGDDLAEGKPTLPLIYAMRKGNDEQAGVIRRAIEAGGRDAFEPVLHAIRDTGALAYARAQAQQEAEVAINALDNLEHSTYKKCLLDLAAFAVARTY